MKEIIGTSNRILEVDVTRNKVDIYEVKPRERRLYLGGKGLGLKLLYDRLRPGADPLGEDNIIAFMPGVLMGTVLRALLRSPSRLSPGSWPHHPAAGLLA
jgi:aldehyde:ferredoxin oxidoreductase